MEHAVNKLHNHIVQSENHKSWTTWPLSTKNCHASICLAMLTDHFMFLVFYLLDLCNLISSLYWSFGCYLTLLHTWAGTSNLVCLSHDIPLYISFKTDAVVSTQRRTPQPRDGFSIMLNVCLLSSDKALC